MVRCAMTVLAAACLLFAQDTQSKPPASQKQEELKNRKPPATSDKEEVPPEEDTALVRDDFSFNPLQAEKEIQAGNYYYKKGNYFAAAKRYQNATKSNEGNGEAWLRLGESEEKLKDRKAARAAYSKYLEVASDAKNAAEIRKKLEKLK